MNWLVKNFLRGIIIVVPIGLTIYLIYEAFVWIDRLLALKTPGVGFAATILMVIAVGALASNFVVSKFLRLTEVVFTRAPLIRMVYAAIRDLLEAFVGDRKRFDQPVAVSITDEVRAIGFITREDLSFLGLPGEIGVYLPFSYSVAGTLIVVPRTRVQKLAIDSASVMSLVVSGGISNVASTSQ
jgi:uncharacterized membrane protein